MPGVVSCWTDKRPLIALVRSDNHVTSDFEIRTAGGTFILVIDTVTLRATHFNGVELLLGLVGVIVLFAGVGLIARAILGRNYQSDHKDEDDADEGPPSS